MVDKDKVISRCHKLIKESLSIRCVVSPNKLLVNEALEALQTIQLIVIALNCSVEVHKMTLFLETSQVRTQRNQEAGS